MNTIATMAKGCVYILSKRYTGKFRKYWPEIQNSQWYSAEKLRSIQNVKLRKLIRYAYHNVPYYRNLFAKMHLTPDDINTVDDLIKLPVLDKETLRTHADSFLSEKMMRISLRKASTSGTTGTPLTLYRTLDNVVYEYATLQRQYMWGGINTRQRFAVLFGDKIVPAHHTTPPFWRYNIAENRLIMSSYHLSEANADAYLGVLLRFRPVALEGYPSSICTLARFIAERIGMLPLTAVFTTSETLTPEGRSLIQRVFQCRVFDYYGMAERVMAIHSCEQGSYHILPEYGIVEFAQLEGIDCEGIYELIATGLNNYAMPLFRYRLGDTVELADKACPCGRAYPTVRRIVGRRDDYITTPQGTLVGRLDHVFKGAHNIVEAQIVQESLTSVEIKIVPDREFCREDGEYVYRKLRDRIGADMSVRITLVKAIPRSKAGKRQGVISYRDLRQNEARIMSL